MAKVEKGYLSDPAVAKDAEAAKPLHRKPPANEELVQHTETIVAPDGGYGWFVKSNHNF
jgi:hypothetical protein